MNYDLEPYLDELDNTLINNINTNLDNVMDDLYFGKKLNFLDVMKNLRILINTNEMYNMLNDKNKEMLKFSSTKLSKDACKSFIISFISTLTTNITPIMFIPSAYELIKGITNYKAYKSLDNEEVINEYLEIFDPLKSRLNDYLDNVKNKYLKFTSKDKAYILLSYALSNKMIDYNEKNYNDLLRILNKELNQNSDNLYDLMMKAFDYVYQEEEYVKNEEIENDENNTLLLKK